MNKKMIIGNALSVIGIALSLYGGIRIDNHSSIIIPNLYIISGFAILIAGLIFKIKKIN